MQKITAYIHSPDEETLLEVRNHWAPCMPKILISFVWIVLPFFFLFPLIQLGTVGVAVFFALVFSGIFFAARSWVAWSKTVFIVTSQRIIDIDQNGFFSRTVSEAAYSDIEDVSWSRKGIMPAILGYGNLEIKIKGAAADLEIFSVRFPEYVQSVINDARRADREHEPISPKEAKLKRLAGRVSEDELERIEEEVRRKDRQVAAERFFKSEKD